MPEASRIGAYVLASIPAVIGVWFVARFAYVSSDTAIDGASNAFLFGMIAVGAYAGPATALMVAANGRKGAAVLLWLLAALAMLTNWSHTLGAIASRGAGTEAERVKAKADDKDDRAELHRLTSERARMTFTRATAETATAARAAVAAAERTRLSECGNGDLRQRGPNCRTRETEEQAARTALTAVLADVALTEQATRLENDAAAVRTRLAKAPPIIDANPLGTALGRLLPMSAATAATFQQGFSSAIVELLIAAALALPELLRKVRTDENREPEPMSELPIADHIQVAENHTSALPILAHPPADVETVGRFMLACFARAADGETTGGEVYARYITWCSEQESALAPLDLPSFAGQFAQRCKRAGIRTRRQGDRVVCVGVKLVA